MANPAIGVRSEAVQMWIDAIFGLRHEEKDEFARNLETLTDLLGDPLDIRRVDGRFAKPENNPQIKELWEQTAKKIADRVIPDWQMRVQIPALNAEDYPEEDRIAVPHVERYIKRTLIPNAAVLFTDFLLGYFIQWNSYKVACAELKESDYFKEQWGCARRCFIQKIANPIRDHMPEIVQRAALLLR